MSSPSVLSTDHDRVRTLTLCRPERHNSITPALRAELAAELEAAQTDETVRVVLLRAEGPSFCVGFGLDWSTSGQANPAAPGDRVWDSVADLSAISPYADTWAKLFELHKPTIAAVQGWCVAGGTDLVLQADLIIAGESARFGYPPARVWGIPEAPWAWIARLGAQRAKRYLFTGDEITGHEAAEWGLALDCVPDAELDSTAMSLAQRIARLPLNQLWMLKLLCNQVIEHAYQPAQSRLLGCLFDGVARHTQEGVDFVATAQRAGWREAVRERDAPFRDYGSRADCEDPSATKGAP